MRRLLLLYFTICLASPSAFAQPERYDAGRRLIAFEQAWDQQADAAARKRSIPFMKNALSNFFANKYGEAARYLDAARNALASSDPPVAGVAWAESLSFRPEKRLVEPTDSDIKLGIKQLYNLDAELPGRLRLSVRLLGKDNAAQLLSEEPQTLPPDIAFGLNGVPEGDHRVEVSLTANEQMLTKFGYQLSVVRNRDQRLSALRAAVDRLPTEGLTTEQRTLMAHTSVLQRLAGRNALETDYPAHRLLVEAESLAALPPDGKYFEASKTGEFWMTLSTAKGEAPIRVFVPPQAREGKPLPLVVAMHGAGGTENMFFDAYGHGEVVRQCEQRGWLLVAPRANFIGSAPIAAIVDELAKRYPVDSKRVFLVGHSMGAGQAMALAQQSPERWAGVAALGGSGRVNKPDAFQQVPLYLGCGTEDFALPGARSVTKTLNEADAKNFVSKEFPDIEHILIVQVALPDVFRWYESLPSR
jgi:predicted esterase